MTTRSIAAPIACSLGAQSLVSRTEWITELNRRFLIRFSRRGALLVLFYKKEGEGEIRELVKRERECCRFLDMVTTRTKGMVRLTIAAPSVASVELDVLFAPFLAAAPTRSATLARAVKVTATAVAAACAVCCALPLGLTVAAVAVTASAAAAASWALLTSPGRTNQAR